MHVFYFVQCIYIYIIIYIFSSSGEILLYPCLTPLTFLAVSQQNSMSGLGNSPSQCM